MISDGVSLSAGPSGCAQHVAATLVDGGAAYNVCMRWTEGGHHTVAIMLHSLHVIGSPFIVETISQVRLLVDACFGYHLLTPPIFAVECTLPPL